MPSLGMADLVDTSGHRQPSRTDAQPGWPRSMMDGGCASRARSPRSRALTRLRRLAFELPHRDVLQASLTQIISSDLPTGMLVVHSTARGTLMSKRRVIVVGTGAGGLIASAFRARSIADRESKRHFERVRSIEGRSR